MVISGSTADTSESPFGQGVGGCFALPDFGRDGVGHVCPVKGTSCHFVIRFASPLTGQP